MTKAVDSDKPVKLVREPIDPDAPIPFRRGRTISVIDAEEIAKPLPEIHYLIDALGLAAGPPSCFSGYGYSRKTLALQDMALSVASGKKLWGAFTVRKGRAIHFDYEQGHRTTCERYQRFARGAGIDLSALGSRLTLANLPEVYLDDENAAESYTRACDGFDLAIIDSFRAACPRADENKSDIRKHLDKLARVSSKTGTCFALILHAGKPPQQQGIPGIGEDAPAAHYSGLRGSSALFDGMNSVFILHGEKNKPTRVQHQKDRTRGKVLPDFGLNSEDVLVDGNPMGGLRMVHIEKEQLDAGRDAEGSLETNQDRIIGFLRKCTHRRLRGTKDTFRGRVGMGAQQFRAALAVLLEDGKVKKVGETSWELADGL